MSNIKLSLIQTSQNRRVELERFVSSLNRQEGIDFSTIQLIFVDQGDNKDVFEKLNSQIEFQYIKSERCSLSHARNIGLQYVQGIYVGYPDDDCWYEPDTLKKVLAVFVEGKYQGVTGKGTNEKGFLTSKFPRNPSIVTKTYRCAAISYTMFFIFKNDVLFDEMLGVGSQYGLDSGEETDYMLSLMEKYGYKIFYCPSIIIHHPTNDDTCDFSKLINKSYKYARGGGFLMQKHQFPFSYYVKMFIRPFCGILIFFFLVRWKKMLKSYFILKGRLEGLYFRL